MNIQLLLFKAHTIILIVRKHKIMSYLKYLLYYSRSKAREVFEKYINNEIQAEMKVRQRRNAHIMRHHAKMSSQQLIDW